MAETQPSSSLRQLSANVLAGGEQDSEPLDEIVLFVKDMPPMPPLPPLPPSPPPLSLDEALTFSKEETTIVFDWDDTLLASHWMHQKGVRASALAETLTLEMVEAFVPLTETVYEILSKAKAMGTVVIITNATVDWVPLSGSLLMPTIMPLLADVRVISAQGKYRHLGISPNFWKRSAFIDEIEGAFQRKNGARRNIISIGDSRLEFEAMQNLRRIYGLTSPRDTFLKAIKLKDMPSIEGLKAQLDNLSTALLGLVNQETNLELMMTDSKEEVVQYHIHLEDFMAERVITVEFSATDMKTVKEVKEKIQQKEGIPVEEQLLSYAGIRLQDEMPLDSYHIFSGPALEPIRLLRHAPRSSSPSIYPPLIPRQVQKTKVKRSQTPARPGAKDSWV
jgi:hypothetical protein